MIPTQGFRHAVRLLLTQSVRAIPPASSPDDVEVVLVRVARELVGLASDMRAEPEWSGWVRQEFNETVERLPHMFDRARVTAQAAEIFAVMADLKVGTTDGLYPSAEPRDLFLIYVPEDRLPVAAPLAIELSKRRVSVTLAEYEVTSAEELIASVTRGLNHHRAGVVLQTRAFDRNGLTAPAAAGDRLRVLRNDEPVPMAEELAHWVQSQRRIGVP